MRPVEARPFLKWLGGKRQLLPKLERYLPETWNWYHEPFVGGGALFFHLRSQGRITRARLSDANAHLMAAYQGVQVDVESVIRHLRRHQKRHSVEYFLKIRKEPPTEDVAKHAAWVIYLNKTAYNGLWRENRAGEFNAPPDKDRKPSAILDEANLRACSEALQRIEIGVGDFAQWGAQRGDLVYFDPPYWPVSKTACFTSYTRDPFGITGQVRLARHAAELARAGVHVVLSGSGAPEVRKLYRGWKIHRVLAKRAVSCKGNGRGPVREVIITGGPS